MSKNGVTARVTPFGVNETAYSHTAGRKIQELFTPPPLFFAAKCGRIEKTGGEDHGLLCDFLRRGV